MSSIASASVESARLLTPDDLANRLSVPVRTIYAWRSKGVGPAGLRVGKHLRFRDCDVEAWITARVDQA